MLQIPLPAENKILLALCFKHYRSSVELLGLILTIANWLLYSGLDKKLVGLMRYLTGYKKFNIGLLNKNLIISAEGQRLRAANSYAQASAHLHAWFGITD